MWFILAGFFILLLTSLGIYIGLSDGGVEIGIKDEINKTSNNQTTIQIDTNSSEFSIIPQETTTKSALVNSSN